MRVSAIRFGTDLWQLLESEAARVGVSVSQYVREAALARATAAAAARGADPFEVLAASAPNAAPAPVVRAPALDTLPFQHASAEVGAARAFSRVASRERLDAAQAARDRAQAAFDAALAVTAESRQTRGYWRKTGTSGHQRT
jgi:hypothetical protein